MKRPIAKTARRHPFVHHGRRLSVAIIGSLVVLVGIVLLFIPGPAFVVIPIGIGILAIEFERPRIWMHKGRVWQRLARRKIARRRRERA